jgi:hypothetical protein
MHEDFDTEGSIPSSVAASVPDIPTWADWSGQGSRPGAGTRTRMMRHVRVTVRVV